MQYLAITSLEQLAAHRDAWDALYRADPRAQLFVSSAWLRAHLSLVPRGWTIHVLRDGDDFVAALPTATRPIPHAALPIARELRFPTDPLADYQSMLCRPGREGEALAQFVDLLVAARWDRLALRHVHDPRVAELVARLARRCDVRLRQGEPAVCYQLDLPATYDAFLERLSKPTRRATKRGLKMLEELGAGRVTFAPDGDPDTHIDAVVRLNSVRWGASRIRERRLKELYRAAFREGVSRFVVIWDGSRPIAAGAALVDALTSTYGFAIVGHDNAYERMSPGKAVLALLVQDAIALGYRTFDFLHGEGEYKKSYATRTSVDQDFELVRPGLRESALLTLMPAYDAVKKTLVRGALRGR